MEVDQDDNNEFYVYIDLNGAVINDYNERKVFFRVANLHTKSPVVQVNELLFKGQYTHSIGTNIFFEKSEGTNPRSLSPIEASVSLKHIATQTKVLSCKLAKVNPKKVAVGSEDSNDFEYNFLWDYNELLKKFEDGTLDFEDLVIRNKANNTTNDSTADTTTSTATARDNNIVIQKVSTVAPNVLQVVASSTIVEHRPEEGPDFISVSGGNKDSLELEEDYKALVKLARTPVRRKKLQQPPFQCDEQFRKSYDYKSMEAKVLYATFTPQLKPLTENLSEIDVWSYVDVNRCILYGLLPEHSSTTKCLDQKQKEKILQIDNFEYLALPLRLYVLKKIVTNLHEYIQTCDKETLQKPDSFNRTPVETLEIYKSLCCALEMKIKDIVNQSNI